MLAAVQSASARAVTSTFAGMRRVAALVVVGVAHAKAPVWADRLRASIEKSFRVGELVMTEIGPVVGTHAGPGLVGAAMFQPTAEELPLIAPLDT